jgi:hypothetical protein
MEFGSDIRNAFRLVSGVVFLALRKWVARRNRGQRGQIELFSDEKIIRASV